MNLVPDFLTYACGYSLIVVNRDHCQPSKSIETCDQAGFTAMHHQLILLGHSDNAFHERAIFYVDNSKFV